MTLPILPREWASDVNFASGPLINLPTKSDPGTAGALQGFVPGNPIAAQHFNYNLNALSKISRRALTLQALATSTSDTGAGALTNEAALAAIAFDRLSGVVIIKSGASNVKLSPESGSFATLGSVASLTSLVTGVARNPATDRIVAIGTGGNNNCFSTDRGFNWIAGGAIGVVPNDIVWNGTRFVVLRSTTALVSHSTDATSWTQVTSLLDNGASGLAVLSNGNTVMCGPHGAGGAGPRFSISTTGGTSWATVGSSTVEDPSSYAESGWICGNSGSTIWHVGRRATNASLRVSSSTDGAAWSTLADLTPGGGVTFTARPRIMCCQNTGLLVIVASTSTGLILSYASLDGGLTWSDSLAQGPHSGSLAGFAVASGRLFVSHSTTLLSSQGVGYP